MLTQINSRKEEEEYCFTVLQISLTLDLLEDMSCTLSKTHEGMRMKKKKRIYCFYENSFNLSIS